MDKQWKKIRDSFQVSAFRAFYNGDNEEKDLTMRFCKAIERSSDIAFRDVDEQQVLDWYKKYKEPLMIGKWKRKPNVPVDTPKTLQDGVGLTGT